MGIFCKTNRMGKKVYGIRYKDSTGKDVKRIVGTQKNLAQAELGKMIERKEREKVLGIQEDKDISFSDFREKFEKFSKAEKKLKTHLSHLNSLKHLGKFFGSCLLSKITVEMIEDYKIKRSKYVKNSSLNRELACLRYMLNLAADWGYTTNNIAKKVKCKAEPEGRIRFLNEDECRKLIEACEPDYLRMIVTIALHTGMRKSEILDLSWEMIDFKSLVIRVDKTKSGKRRFIPINDCLLREFQWWHTQTGGNGKLFTIKEFKKSFRTALKKAGISDFHFHDLRHTFASLLVKNEVPLYTLSKLMGHSNPTMTDRYAHLSPDYLVEEVNKLKVIDFGQVSKNE